MTKSSLSENLTVHNTGIYKITNTVNGKCYVGSAVHIGKRIRDHLKMLKSGRHHSRYLQMAWNKHGITAFEFGPILFCDKENLLFYEQRFIDFFKSANGHGYNLALKAGSNLGITLSDEAKAKMSIAKKGKATWNTGKKVGPLSDEHKAKISAAGTGAKRSEKTKNNISAALMGRKFSDEHRRNLSSAHKGKVIPEKARIKMSEAHKGEKNHYYGKTHSKEIRQKMSDAHKGNNNCQGRVLSEITRLKISESLKKYNRSAKGRSDANSFR